MPSNNTDRRGAAVKSDLEQLMQEQIKARGGPSEYLRCPPVNYKPPPLSKRLLALAHPNSILRLVVHNFDVQWFALSSSLSLL